MYKCIMLSSTHKYPKRIERLKYCLKNLNLKNSYDISNILIDTKKKEEYIILNNKYTNVFKRRNLFFHEPKSLYLKQYLSRYATSLLNKDGHIHRIMSNFAVIIYSKLYESRKNYPQNSVYYDILENSKLIFKGGSSIGKYSLKQSEYVKKNFIDGNDNDVNIFVDYDLIKCKDVDTLCLTLDQISKNMFYIIDQCIRAYDLVSIVSDYAKYDINFNNFHMKSSKKNSYIIDDYFE